MPNTESNPSDDSGPVSTGYREGRMRARVELPLETIAPLGYLTPQEEFGDVERGNPLPYTLPIEQRRNVGLERETWKLEVFADPTSNTVLENPLTIENGNAIDFDGLLKLGDEHGVQYMKAITCNNIGEPLGMGLWEGVPLRVVIWKAQPVENVRRVFYYGYYNDDPAQMFRSSLPIGRVLEDPPGELPVMLCYKLNGEFLTGKRGGPVRMVVPEAYGFKSVKWLQKVALTNNYQANDTYALGNNDLESPMKTFARFAHVPPKVKTGEPFKVTGVAQVGVSGLERVQYWLQPSDVPTNPNDPNFAHGDWQNADILPPPENWGGDLPNGKLQATPLRFDPSTGEPRQWPMTYSVVHWEAVLRGVAPGSYILRCRSIDQNGIAQPMPRPFAKSGRAEIHEVTLVVEE